jgi:hypothetical protein
MFPTRKPSMSHSELHQCAQYARARMARHGMEWMFAMPLYVLGHFFGADWVRQHLFEDGFLKPPSMHVDRAKQQEIGSQAFLLAENLFNLQGVDGFSDVYKRILSGQIEDCVAELEVARLVKLRGDDFRFVLPRGRKGEDYDLEILKIDLTIHCETKSKLEARELSANQVWRRLDDARKQLPKEKPCLIFLRIGGDHTRSGIQAKAAVVQAGVEKVFRQSTKVLGVILLTRMFEGADEDFEVRTLWRMIPNAQCKFPASLLDSFRHQSVKEPSSSWTYLATYRPRFAFGWTQ